MKIGVVSDTHGNGKYISEQERYEKTGYDCIFRLVIPEEI